MHKVALRSELCASDSSHYLICLQNTLNFTTKHQQRQLPTAIDRSVTANMVADATTPPGKPMKSLLDLPPELRNQIYEEVVNLQYAAGGVKINCRGQITDPLNSLGAVCRRTREEYSPVFKNHARQHVTSFLAQVDTFHFLPLESTLRKLFPSTPSELSNGKRTLVLQLDFIDVRNDSNTECLTQWLKSCKTGDLLAAFDRRYCVEFDWSCFDVDDAQSLQSMVQDQVQVHRGEEDYVQVLHAMIDAEDEQRDEEGRQSRLMVKTKQN